MGEDKAPAHAISIIAGSGRLFPLPDPLAARETTAPRPRCFTRLQLRCSEPQ